MTERQSATWITPSAITAIESADLPAPQYRTAIRLAQLCADGPAVLSYDDALEVCGTESDHTVRGHLAGLHRAGLINYKRNAAVTVWWTAGGTEPDRPARESRVQRAPIDDNLIATRADRASDDHEDADDDERRAVDDQIARTAIKSRVQRANRAVDDQPKGYPRQSTTGRQAGYPGLPEPSGSARGAPSAAEQSRTVALLTDDEVGIDGELARRIAAEFPFEQVLRQVFRLRHDMAQGKVRSPGALLTRLREGYGACITDADKRSGLYQRHVDAEDEAAARRRRYIPDELADTIIG